MRSAGLSVEMLSEYVRLFQEGDSTIPARRDLLMEAREEIAIQLNKYKKTIDKLNYKISIYDEDMKTGVLEWNISKNRRDFKMEFMTLNNGQKCPVIGLGTWNFKL